MTNRFLLIVGIGSSLLLSTVNAAEDPLCVTRFGTGIPVLEDITIEPISPSITIGFRADTPPFSFQSENGEPDGYVVRLCRQVITSLQNNGIIREFSFQVISADDRWNALDGGRIDLLCDSSTLTLERHARYSSSLMVFPSGPGTAINTSGAPHRSLLARTSSIERLRVGILGGSSTIQQYCDHRDQLANEFDIEKENIVSEEIYSYGEGVDRLSATGGHSGAALDLLFADREILLAKFQDKKNIHVGDKYFGYEPYAIFARKGAIDLINAVNFELVEIFSDVTIHDMLNEYFAYRVRDVVGQLIILQRLPLGNLPAVDPERPAN